MACEIRRVYAIERCCKVRYYKSHVEYLTPMHVFCLGLSQIGESAW